MSQILAEFHAGSEISQRAKKRILATVSHQIKLMIALSLKYDKHFTGKMIPCFLNLALSQSILENYIPIYLNYHQMHIRNLS